MIHVCYLMYGPSLSDVRRLADEHSELKYNKDKGRNRSVCVA